MDDAKHAVIVFGPNLESLCEKTRKIQEQHMATFLPITMPSYIKENHELDTLYMNDFYVNGNIFLTQ